ncbi:TPA: hypothetical protein U1D13_001252 [Streptococcus suis]|nr:hypothetical protein [Streptococcus suis]HEM3626844.1 hypothetical protein [Streptococcus suis]HEM3653545.1 hypothetical protein [Streptococcus suis]HEM3656957.1 hypothetical protein [Streptococcus suis]HEM3700473.1 hypothetical protein [Streptococcus suis]
MTFIFRIWEALLHGFVVAILLMLAFYPVCFLEIRVSAKTDRKMTLPASIALICFCLIVIPKRLKIISMEERRQVKRKDKS